jgi:hypothetical protein
VNGEGRNRGQAGFNRDKASLDIFWLRPKSDNLPDPDVLAQEIVEELKATPVLVRSMEIFDACAISTETVDGGTTETFAALLLGGHV